MKAVILAAGKGTRMRPLTLETPKPMVDVLGKPLLHHIIDSLPAEIAELILVVGYKQEQIRAYFGDSFEGRKVTYVEQKERLGTAHALFQAQPHLTKGERFLFMFADDLHSPSAIERLVKSGKIGALVQEHIDPKRFGVIEIDKDGKIVSLEEKPDQPRSNLVAVGVFIFDDKFFQYPLKLSSRGEYEYVDQVKEIIKDHQFIVEKTEFWHPISDPYHINEAEQILSKGAPAKTDNTLIIILAGGKGTRMPDGEKDKPKVMVDIAGKPLLEHQIEIAMAQGFTNIRLSLGYMADYIIDWLKEKNYKIGYVVENEPLGTGGAIKLAAKGHDKPFIAINGDDIADVNYRALARHSGRGKYSVITGLELEGVSAFGLLEFDKDKRIVAFKEKQPDINQGVINIGHYYLLPEIFENTPEAFSIEHDLFPKLAQDGKLVLMEHKGNYWFGCGTPETLKATRAYFAKSHD